STAALARRPWPNTRLSSRASNTGGSADILTPYLAVADGPQPLLGLAAVGAGLATARGEAAAYARQLQIRGGALERDRSILTACGIDAQHRTHQRLRVRGHTAKDHVLGRS